MREIKMRNKKQQRIIFEAKDLDNVSILNKINNFMDDENWDKVKLQEDLKNFSEVMEFSLKNRELLDPYQVMVLYWKKKFIFEKE